MRGKGASTAVGAVALLAAGAAAAEKPAAGPLKSSSAWNVDYADTNCTLGRRFADGKPGEEDDTILMFRATPLSNTVQLLLGRQSHDRDFEMGKGEVRLGSRAPVVVKYEMFPSSASRRYVLRTSLTFADLADLPPTVDLVIEPERGASYSLTLVGGRAAMSALAKCNEDLTKTWGIDPDEWNKVARAAQPIGDASRWFGPADYPKEAIRKGMQGSTMILFAIGTDGRIVDCRVVVSSGVAELDRIVCPTLAKRARYTPAVDIKGTPMLSHMTRNMKWLLPEGWRGEWD